MDSDRLQVINDCNKLKYYSLGDVNIRGVNDVSI